MDRRVPNLWTFRGRVDRSNYLLVGLALFAMKFFLDYFLAVRCFHLPWDLSRYFALGTVFDIHGMSENERNLSMALLAVSLPFLWIGIAMSARRLRDAGLPPALAILFVLRPLNWLLIASLVLMRSGEKLSLAAEAQGVPRAGTREKERYIEGGWLDPFVSEDAVKRSCGSVTFTVAAALALTDFGVRVLGNYGVGLFIALPIFVGFLPAWIDNYYEARGSVGIWLSLLAMLIYGVGLLVVAAEGAICLVMAAPLGFGLAAFGGAIGVSVAQSRYLGPRNPPVMCAAFLAVPFIMLADHVQSPKPPLLAVRSVVVIDAPADRVWRNVVAFPRLAPPTELMFRSGIAYPMDAKIIGRGPGAVRHCNFSTGAFVEPITVWDEPHLLRFSVAEQPEPMRELSPYDIHPRHLHGYLHCEQGQFQLHSLPDGRTELVGTTWYRNYFWPQPYWRLWTDRIIHTIHLRVLGHIKSLSEKRAASAAVP